VFKLNSVAIDRANQQNQTNQGAEMTAGRGVLYMKWGSKIEPVFQRSLQSLRKFHPDLPVQVAELPPTATLLDKARMLEISPFEHTLFLDTDTVVMDKLDFGFEKSARFGLACCVCECPWARRYGGLSGDLIEYNTGVLFFTRAMKPLFDLWIQHARTLDSSILFKRGNDPALLKMPFNDQGGFALAVEQSGINPYVLPLNWNFRPIWQHILCGPIKIWHDYSAVPPGLEGWNQRQAGEQKVIEFTKLQ
jgi:hypothetical protein